MSSAIPITDKSSPLNTETRPFERIESPPMPINSMLWLGTANFNASIKFEPKISPENSPAIKKIFKFFGIEAVQSEFVAGMADNLRNRVEDSV